MTLFCAARLVAPIAETTDSATSLRRSAGRRERRPELVSAINVSPPVAAGFCDVADRTLALPEKPMAYAASRGGPRVSARISDDTRVSVVSVASADRFAGGP